MNARRMTADQINTSGLEALRDRLGVVGMLRFLQQYETGWGDYSKDRHEWLDGLGLDAWAQKLEMARKKDQP